jgi:hypothetical protein
MEKPRPGDGAMPTVRRSDAFIRYLASRIDLHALEVAGVGHGSGADAIRMAMAKDWMAMSLFERYATRQWSADLNAVLALREAGNYRRPVPLSPEMKKELRRGKAKPRTAGGTYATAGVKTLPPPKPEHREIPPWSDGWAWTPSKPPPDLV